VGTVIDWTIFLTKSRKSRRLCALDRQRQTADIAQRLLRGGELYQDT
jgi:hypothetical protein